MNIIEFERKLQQTNLSQNTVESYKHAVAQYLNLFLEVNKNNLLAFKGWLMENYHAKTVNLHVLALNKYLEFLGKDNLKLKLIRIQQKPFLENVISDADYDFFKNRLKQEGRLNWYFVVRFLAATGARISELVQIKVEHVAKGYLQ